MKQKKISMFLNTIISFKKYSALVGYKVLSCELTNDWHLASIDAPCIVLLTKMR